MALKKMKEKINKNDSMGRTVAYAKPMKIGP